MQLPTTWNNISVGQFMELKELQVSSFDSVFDYHIESISILTDTDVNDIYDLDFDELTGLMNQLHWLSREPNKPIKKTIKELHYIGFDSLKVGEFIDLEYYFTNDYNKHLSDICAVCYRKKRLNEWGNEIIEPYEYNVAERKELFLDISCADVYGVVKDYIKFREYFMNAYGALFNEEVSEDEEEELTEDDKQAIKEEEKQTKWSWEKTLYTLANENTTQIDSVLTMNVIFAFNLLSMKTELAI